MWLCLRCMACRVVNERGLNDMNSKGLRILITKYKEANQMSNYDVGLEIGISQNTVRRFVLGEDILPSTLEKIEKFFTRDCEEKTELEKLKEENALLKEQLLKKSETEQSFQSLLDENKELKEKVKSLESEIRQKKMTIMMNNDHYLTVDENNRNYRSALEEIREIAEKSIKISYNLEVNSMLYDIIDKINEVLK